MRILHIVHQFPPEHIGGTELYVQAMSQTMAQRGHTIAVFAGHSAEQAGHLERMEGDVQIHLAHHGLFTPTRRYLASFGDKKVEAIFDNVLHQFRPDIVHVHHLMGLPFGILDALRRRGIPFVASLVDYWWVCANAQLVTNYDETICNGPRGYLNCTRCAVARSGRSATWLMSPLILGSLVARGAWLRRWTKAAYALIAPTSFVADWYLAHGAPRQSVRVVRLGVDTAGKVPSHRHVPSAAQPEADRPMRFLYVGGISRQKGVHLVVDAFRRVQGKAELWVAGDDKAYPTYTSELQQLANAQVRFLGRLNRAEVWEALAQVDVVLVPSQWYETYCFVLHEAFAANLPVIATRLGVLEEAVAHGENGLLVEPGDVEGWRAAMQSVLDEPALLDRLRQGIRPPVTLDENASQLLHLYAEAVAEVANQPQSL